MNVNRTPLFKNHVELGARIVNFAGWEMPIQYHGILGEVHEVRTNAGLFDVSHMGRLEIKGPHSAKLLDRILSVRASTLVQGRARYNLICNEEGGIIDDCIVYKRSELEFLLVPNASNTLAVVDWINLWKPTDCEVTVTNVTSQSAMIANQGPNAEKFLQRLTATDLSLVRPFSAVEANVAGHPALVARTGYTGEDGFEIILPADTAPIIWNNLVESGSVPCGLGARDVLRLEAGLLLHGNDMNLTINPYEASLDKFVKLERPDYIAGANLNRIKTSKLIRKIVGFKMIERGIARHGYAISNGKTVIGDVSSGGPSPTLDMNIGLGYVPTEYSTSGSAIQILIRGRPVKAEVTTLPFYKRRRNA